VPRVASISAVNWSTFWPAFIATASGVILGIPAGFLLNTLIGSFNGRKAREVEATRLSDTLLAIAVSLDVNEAAFARLQRRSPTAVVLSHGFDLATWDMTKTDFQKLVKPNDFRIPLAQYFEDVRQVLEILNELNRFSVGVNSALESAPGIRNAISELLQKRIPLAIEKGTWLRSQIVELDGRRILKHPPDRLPHDLQVRASSLNS
jgi:hypothetical protein